MIHWFNMLLGSIAMICGLVIILTKQGIESIPGWITFYAGWVVVMLSKD